MLLYRLAPGRVPSIVLTENGYLIPRADGAVLAGSTLKEGDDSTHPTEEGRRKLEAMAASILPALADQAPEHHWAGVRPGCGRTGPIWARCRVPGACSPPWDTTATVWCRRRPAPSSWSS